MNAEPGTAEQERAVPREEPGRDVRLVEPLPPAHGGQHVHLDERLGQRGQPRENRKS